MTKGGFRHVLFKKLASEYFALIGTTLEEYALRSRGGRMRNSFVKYQLNEAEKEAGKLFAVFLLLAVVAVFAWSAPENHFLSEAGLNYGRGISSSMTFPSVQPEDDTSDILASYPLYLKFVLEIGKEVDRNSAKKLESLYLGMKSHSQEAAARFLKGLRFEMVQKVELMGVAPQSLNTHTPEMRRWVKRFLPDWVREADEQWFRAATKSAIAKSK